MCAKLLPGHFTQYKSGGQRPTFSRNMQGKSHSSRTPELCTQRDTGTTKNKLWLLTGPPSSQSSLFSSYEGEEVLQLTGKTFEGQPQNQAKGNCRWSYFQNPLRPSIPAK